MSLVLKCLLLISALLVQDNILSGLDPQEQRQRWYLIHIAFDLIILLSSLSIKELRTVLTSFITADAILNALTYLEYTGRKSRFLYDYYPHITTNIYNFLVHFLICVCIVKIYVIVKAKYNNTPYASHNLP